MNFVDSLLDHITMYRLIFYELVGLLLIACMYGAFGLVAYSPMQLLLSTGIIAFVCWVSNAIFSYAFNAPTNIESVYISALILSLIVAPIHSIHDLPFLGWIALWAMASKYMFAIKKKHIFNPVAIAAVVVAYGLGQSPNWWIGNSWMAPWVVIFGLLLIRKIQREDLVWSFFVSAGITITLFTIFRGGDVIGALQSTLLSSSLLFFGFIMLTEPLTTPPTKNLQIIYGLLVGFLFAPQVNIVGIYLTPELALLIGNIFSYLVSPKQKLILQLKEKIQVGLDQIDFIFTPSEKVSFSPGQYMEWTLQHHNTDSRGNRRYFTLASSPTENDIHLGIKFYPQGSSFKKALLNFTDNQQIVASGLAGDFTLPTDTTKHLVFLAGGIGITPFRSMIKYILDSNKKYRVTLLYSNKTVSEIMYLDVLSKAQEKGMPVMYTLTDTSQISPNWKGERGRITSSMIQKYIPDFADSLFYLSGPHQMVTGFETTLKHMGVASSHIKKDFFPGFA